MSDKAKGWVVDNSPYSGSSYIVHYMMADLSNDTYDYQLWCGDEYLARKCRVTTKTIQRTRREMLNDGFLEVVDGKPGPGKTVTYRLVIPGLTVDISASTVDISSSTVDICDSAPITNKKNKTYTPEFLEVWEIYPRRENKPGTAKAFQARRAEGIEYSTLLSATKNFAKQMKSEGRELKHIMLGATFFGPNERYLDYETPPGAAVTPPTGDLAVRATAMDKWWIDRVGEPPPPDRRPYAKDGKLVTADGRLYRVNGGKQVFD